MGRHAPRRAARTTLVSTLAVAVAAGSITLFSSTEDTGAQAATTATAGTTEIVLDDPRSDTPPRTERLLAAGATGYLHRQSGVAGLLWTGYGDATTAPARAPSRPA
ncbi:hypothetical protein [Streptomyces canus]|uniref:hypothetical protein n=1 Tax=Streptomyces canus TaxID=58343 RepID=UPI002DD8CFAD|nr:hypothetical protein [Streptomyces canus]WSD87324.1 hypothetical protein OG925_24800 [Streptomyces canus]